MTTVPAPPLPPRLDGWPHAVRSAALLRGTAVRCGPGLRLLSWPDTPGVRAAAVSRCFEGGRIAAHLTAAWIWGAAERPGDRLEFISRRREPIALTESGLSVVQYDYRLAATEHRLVGGLPVTTPTRTLYDLLRAPVFEAPHRLACRFALAYLSVRRADLLGRPGERSRPFARRVRHRLREL